MKYLIGIDNGGTFTKVAVFTETGEQVSVVSVATETKTPKQGFAEKDMEVLWKNNALALKQAIQESNINSTDIAAISLSGHGKGLYVLGKSGEIIYNGILSTDSRAWMYAQRWEKNGVAKKIFDKTYQGILACQPVCLLAWMRDNEPEVYKRIGHIFSIKDYIRYKLTGKSYSEYTDFSGGNLVNLNTSNYDYELLDEFGIADIFPILPPLKYATEICGYITKEVAESTGLREGIPVTAGMFDVDACGIAVGLTDEDVVCMIAGTWSINEFIAKKPIVNGTVKLNSMYCIPKYFLVEESSPTSAGNLEWFIKNILDQDDLKIRSKGDNIYDHINRWVEAVDPHDSKLIFLPFLNGSNVNTMARGTLIGLSSYHEKKHILRAVYEGIVFSHKMHVDRLFKNRKIPESLRLTGGATKSDVWLQIFADVFQIPIDVIEDKELGAHGAAIAAGVGVGIYKNFDEACRTTVKISKRVIPRVEYKVIYQEKYEMYNSVICALDGVWQPFNNL